MQSVNNKKHILELFLHKNESDYQAVCITESWLTDEKRDLLHVNGYLIASSYCRKKHVGGGVCILLQDNIQFIERKDIVDITVEYVIEICAVEIPKQNLLLITLYWNEKETDTFYNQLSKLLNLLANKYSKYNVIIGGDFNTDIGTGK